MTEWKYRATVVVPIAFREVAESAWSLIDPITSARSFTVKLAPDDELPPTHVWCSTAMKGKDLAKLEEFSKVVPQAAIWLFAAHPNGKRAVLNARFNKPEFASGDTSRRNRARVRIGNTDPNDILSVAGLRRVSTS